MFKKSATLEHVFMDLDPSLQILFKGDVNNISMGVLVEAAGLTDSKNISQAQLIEELKKKGITLSSTDLAKIRQIETVLASSAPADLSPTTPRKQ